MNYHRVTTTPSTLDKLIENGVNFALLKPVIDDFLKSYEVAVVPRDHELYVVQWQEDGRELTKDEPLRLQKAYELALECAAEYIRETMLDALRTGKKIGWHDDLDIPDIEDFKYDLDDDDEEAD